MTNKNTISETPSEVLAERVVQAFVNRNLVLEDDANKMKVNLATGKLKDQDWRLLIEKAIDKGVKDV